MTLGDLRGLIRLTLTSASAWPDGTPDRWIQSAIRLYSEHFPRRYRAQLTLSAGVQSYTVPGGLSSRGVISVEYPAGETPPRFLVRVSEASALFGAGGRCYVVRGVEEDDAAATGWLVIQADKIILIGHSAGGALAQRYALAHGDRLEKLVLVGSVPATGGFERSGPVIETGYALINVFGGNLPARDPLQADAHLAAIQTRTSLSRLYDPAHPELLDDFGYVSFAVNRDITRSTWGGNFDATLAGFKAPPLIIYGLADRSEFTGEPIARRLHEILPDSTLVAFEKSEHWPYLEEPERFREVLLNFLSGRGAAD